MHASASFEERQEALLRRILRQKHVFYAASIPIPPRRDSTLHLQVNFLRSSSKRLSVNIRRDDFTEIARYTHGFCADIRLPNALPLGYCAVLAAPEESRAL